MLCVRLVIALLSALTFQACAPIVESIAFKNIPSKPADHPILIYREGQRPECPYEEVGRVTSVKRNSRVSMEDTMEALKARVRKLGGDGVVELAIKNEGSELPFRDPTILGTVIEFTDSNCKEADPLPSPALNPSMASPPAESPSAGGAPPLECTLVDSKTANAIVQLEGATREGWLDPERVWAKIWNHAAPVCTDVFEVYAKDVPPRYVVCSDCPALVAQIRSINAALKADSSGAAETPYGARSVSRSVVTAPLLGPPHQDAYGPGIYSDATGRPFQYRTNFDNQPVLGPVVPNGYGLGVHMDQFGRPVHAAPWP